MYNRLFEILKTITFSVVLSRKGQIGANTPSNQPDSLVQQVKKMVEVEKQKNKLEKPSITLDEPFEVVEWVKPDKKKKKFSDLFFEEDKVIRVRTREEQESDLIRNLDARIIILKKNAAANIRSVANILKLYKENTGSKYLPQKPDKLRCFKLECIMADIESDLYVEISLNKKELSETIEQMRQEEKELKQKKYF